MRRRGEAMSGAPVTGYRVSISGNQDFGLDGRKLPSYRMRVSRIRLVRSNQVGFSLLTTVRG
jgi:hypothetical protein